MTTRPWTGEEEIKRKVCIYCGTPWGQITDELSCKKCGAPLPDEAMEDQKIEHGFGLDGLKILNPLSVSYGQPRVTRYSTDDDSIGARRLIMLRAWLRLRM